MEECIICFDETTQFIFLPCAHKLCIHCKERLEHKICPICNTRFEPEHRIQIQIPDEPVRMHRYTMDGCSRGMVLCLVSFATYVVFQSFKQSE